ncbi:MAG: disulfide bond formation protein B [Dehalococcoidia bacterium]
MESEPYVSPILALAALAVVFAALLLHMFLEFPPAARLRGLVEGHAQKLMLAVALTATVASLYYSEVVSFIPCEFCWYQRIMMYPLAVLLVVGVATRTRLQPRFLVALAGIGLCLSIYHYQLQLFPEQARTCGENGTVSCTDRNVEEFVVVSIPFMAGAGFFAVLLLQLAEWRAARLASRWAAPEGEGLDDVSQRGPARA